MPIANNDILRVVAKMSWGGDDIQNVYHLKANVSSDPGDSTTVDEIADWLDDAYGNISGQLHDDINWDSIAVWNVTTSTFLGEVVWPTLVPTTNTNDPLPPQCAPLVLFNTNVNRSQGRKFLFGFHDGTTDDTGTIQSATLSLILSFANAILAGVSGTGWSAEAGNWNAVLDRFVAWSNVVVRDFIATQRRRYAGRGS